MSRDHENRLRRMETVQPVVMPKTAFIVLARDPAHGAEALARAAALGHHQLGHPVIIVQGVL